MFFVILAVLTALLPFAIFLWVVFSKPSSLLR